MAVAIQTAEFGAVHLQMATDRVWQALIEVHIGQLAKAEQDARPRDKTVSCTGCPDFPPVSVS